MNNSEQTGLKESPEELIEHINRLMAEAEAMLVGPVAGEPLRDRDRIAEIKRQLEEAGRKLGSAYASARKNVVAGARYADEAIREHPYQAVAMAAGLGLILGLLLRRD